MNRDLPKEQIPTLLDSGREYFGSEVPPSRLALDEDDGFCIHSAGRALGHLSSRLTHGSGVVE